MRKLQNSDVFTFGRIIKEANIKEEIKQIATDKNASPESLGFDLLFILFTNCSNTEVETEIYSFMSDIFEMPVEEVKKLDPIDTIEKLKGVADWERWKTVFSLGVKSVISN